MKTQRPINDEDVIRMLGELKNMEVKEYPASTQKQRRAAFMAQVAGVGIAGAGIKNLARAQVHLHSAAEAWVTTAMVVTIVADAALAGYHYRNEITNFFFPTPEATPTQVVENQAKNPVPAATKVPTNAPTFTAMPSASPSASPSPSATVSPVATFVAEATNTDNSSGPVNIAATKVPTEKSKDNQGKHTGQTATPKPKRP